MLIQEKELHTKFKLLLSGQGYVEGGVINVSPWDAAPKRKYSRFQKLFTSSTLLSLYKLVSSSEKSKR